jgi:hypothetical protein
MYVLMKTPCIGQFGKYSFRNGLWMVVNDWLIDWLLLNVQRAAFQLYKEMREGMGQPGQQLLNVETPTLFRNIQKWFLHAGCMAHSEQDTHYVPRSCFP